MRKPQTALIWRAVSSEDQVQKDNEIKASLEYQLRLGHEQAARHELRIIAELTVPGESRYITLLEDAREQVPGLCTINDIEQECRPYQVLFDMIRAKQKRFDVLICLNTSRLGRKASLLMAIIDLCKDANIIVYECQSPLPSLDLDKAHSYNDMLMHAINAVRDQQEVIKLVENNAMGMIRRVENGNFPHLPPWGWTYTYEVIDNQPRLVVDVDPVASAVIQYIVNRYLVYGDGQHNIAEQLNQAGHATPLGKTWYKSSIQFIIRRIWLYAGYNEVNKHSKKRTYTRAKSKWPAIITEAEAEAIEIEKKRRAGARRSVAPANRFSQCVWCATCAMRVAKERGLDTDGLTPDDLISVLGEDVLIAGGARMKMNRSGSVSDGKYYQKFQMRCRHKHPGATVVVKRIDEAVLSLIDNLGKIEHPIEQPMINQSRILLNEIANHENTIKKTEQSIARVHDDYYVHNKLDSDNHDRLVLKLNEQIKTYQGEILRIREKLVTEENLAKQGERLQGIVQHGLAMLNNEDTSQANAWIRQHIRVWIADNQVIQIANI